MIKASLLGALALLALTTLASAGEGPLRLGDVQYTASGEALPLLPRRFQNHCGWYFGHYVCANHCGLDYQFYYCTAASFGCCHLGYGYCDYHGRLRCRP